MGRPDQDFVAYLAAHLPLIERQVLACAPQAAPATGERHDLDRYVFGPLRSFVSSGGKRTRPALCLLGAEAVGADPAVALPAAAAVELFQAAALIHDDIADKSEYRRGKPCLHVTEGTGLAVNAGDAALVAVVQSVLHEEALPDGLRLRLLEELMAMEERTLEGQALDLGWARDARWDLGVDDYLFMASHKTAYYSAATPLAMGALCGGGDERQVEGLRAFGIGCGLAFQIQDDLLNLTGDAEAQGKDYRSDITEGKRTLLTVHALSHLAGAARDELVGILSAGTTDADLLCRAVALMDEAGSLAFADTYAHTLVAQAKDELADLDIAEGAAGMLRSMADFFVERSH